jgi:hypothetical protein
MKTVEEIDSVKISLTDPMKPSNDHRKRSQKVTKVEKKSEIKMFGKKYPTRSDSSKKTFGVF